MPRIRTIKPEFWTDEKIVQLPFEARLLFIGLWNFADDEGWLYESSERIGLQILPSDDVDVAVLLDLLVAAELLDRYETKDGRLALAIRRFSEHQKVSHASASKIAPESSGKLQIPSEVRRAVARKYGCEPGCRADVTCYYCGLPGKIYWSRTTKGRPGSWVAFDLELDHFVAESENGATSCDNLVLACRRCNRSKQTNGGFSRMLQNLPEDSRGLQPELKRNRRGKGIEEDITFPIQETSVELPLDVGPENGPDDSQTKKPSGRKRRTKAPVDRSQEILAVVAHYRKYHPRYKQPTSKSVEWRKIRDRLTEGYGVDELTEAIDGMHKTPHNLGLDDRGNQTGKKYLGLDLCMRTASQVDRFIGNNSTIQSQQREQVL